MTDTSVTDVELVAAAEQRSVRAFLMLQARYSAFMLSTARRLGFQDPADTEQECWLQLLRGRWRLDADSRHATLRPFIVVLLTRLRQREHRRLSRLVPILVAAEDDGQEEGAVVVPVALDRHPLDVLIEREQCDTLREAIGALSHHDRTLVRLRYEDGLTFAEMARLDGRTPSTLHHHLQRIRRALAADCGVPMPAPRRVPPVARLCACGRSFAGNQRTRYCSPACAAAAHRASSRRHDHQRIQQGYYVARRRQQVSA